MTPPAMMVSTNAVMMPGKPVIKPDEGRQFHIAPAHRPAPDEAIAQHCTASQKKP